MDGSKVYANDYGYGYFWTLMYPYYNFLRYEGLFWGMPMYCAYVYAFFSFSLHPTYRRVERTPNFWED